MDSPETPELYDLCGVLVHMGSAQSGHYFSHIQVEKGKWWTFNDTRVSACDSKQWLEQSIGGGSKLESTGNTSGYLLFYGKRNREQSDNSHDDIRLDVLGRLLAETRHGLLRQVFQSEPFARFLCGLCETDPDGRFLFSYLKNVLETHAKADVVKDLVRVSKQVLSRNRDYADFMLSNDTGVLDLILLSERELTRNVYSELAAEAVKFASEEIRPGVVERILDRFAGEITLDSWHGFGSLVRPLLAVSMEGGGAAKWVEICTRFVTGTFPAFAAAHQGIEFFALIDFSAIFELLVVLIRRTQIRPKPPSDPKWIDAMSKSEYDAESFTSILAVLCENPDDTSLSALLAASSTEMNVSMLAVLFVLGITARKLSLSQKSPFVNSLRSLRPNACTEFWAGARALVPPDSTDFMVAFVPNADSFIQQFIINRDPKIRYAASACLTRVIDHADRLEQPTCENLFDFFSKRLSSLLDATRTSYGRLEDGYINGKLFQQEICTGSYFAILGCLVNKFPLQPKLVASASKLTDFMKKCGDMRCVDPRCDCFQFIHGTLLPGSIPEFFRRGSYSDFLKGFDNWIYDSANLEVHLALLEQVFSLAPPDGGATFLESNMTYKLTMHLFGSPGRDQPVEDCVRKFVLSIITEANLGIFVDAFWNPQFLQRASRFCSLTYHHLTWQVLKRVPKAANKFEDYDLHQILWRILGSAMIPGSRTSQLDSFRIKLMARTLSAFNFA
jgi:hypothetical protein